MATRYRRSIQNLFRHSIATRNIQSIRPALCSVRSFSDNQGETNSVHFRRTTSPHPLATKDNTLKAKPLTSDVKGEVSIFQSKANSAEYVHH